MKKWLLSKSFTRLEVYFMLATMYALVTFL
jgi:hypothetical protein